MLMGEWRAVWVCYTWDLHKVRTTVAAPEGYEFCSAARGDCREVIDVVLSAYASDPTWRPKMQDIRGRMTERIETTLGAADVGYLVAKRGGLIVAVSGVAREHWTGQNLLTGVCVLPEHRGRGLGRHLLGLSLLRLLGMGLRRAQVYTESGTLADRRLYPSFGSRRVEGVFYPGAARG